MPLPRKIQFRSSRSDVSNGGAAARKLLGVLAGLMLAFSAHADRILPQGGNTGVLTGPEYSQARIGDKTYRFSPGMRIYDQSNRTIVSGALPPTAKVYFRLDSQGELSQVWLLTPEEASLLAR